MLSRLLASAVLGVCAFAQQGATDVFDKAPPETDAALRARVAKFFQAHVDGKFRQAEQVIAEDSKDAYYEMDKQRYYSFDIVKIVYSENYTKATVVTAVEVDWRSPRVGSVRVKPPLTSLWKVENGEWCWYVEPKKDSWDTPFGKMTPGPDAKDGKSAAPLSGPHGVDPSLVMSGVKADHATVKLASYQASTATVTITNAVIPGEVKIDYDCPVIQGLTAKLDRQALNRGQSAHLTFSYEPPAGKPLRSSVVAHVKVQPTSQEIPIRIEFAFPPEYTTKVPR